MKLEKEEYYIERSKGLEEYKFKLPEDSTGIKLIMDLLSSNLYSDKVESSLREIYTNAIDANIEAGNAHIPIDITCPTEEDPYVSFRDYGLGMSPERVVQTYINLGVSTKRETNNLHGGFGIGSISPFTITNQIQVTTYNKGIQYSWLIYKGEEGIPVSSLLDKRESSEPSGTLVKFRIPENRLYTAVCYLNSLNLITPTKSNLKRIREDFIKEKESLVIQETEDYVTIFPVGHKTNYWSLNFYILIGDIPYPIKGVMDWLPVNNLPVEVQKTLYATNSNTTPSYSYYPIDVSDYFSFKNHFNLFLKVPIGELTLTSSRENVVIDNKLKSFVGKRFNAVLEKAFKSLKSLKSNIDNKVDLVDKIETAFNTFPILSSFEIEDKTCQLRKVSLDSYNNNLSYFYDLDKVLQLTVVFKATENRFTLEDIKEKLLLFQVNKEVQIQELPEKNLKYIDLINPNYLKNLDTLKITTLLKSDIVLVKANHKLSTVLKQYEFNDDNFTLVIRVKSNCFEYFKNNLSNIKEIKVYKSPYKREKPVEKKEVDINKLSKEDVVYKLKDGLYINENLIKFKEIIGSPIYSLSDVEGYYIVKQNLNDLTSRETRLNLKLSLKYLDISNKIYVVNERVAEVLKTDKNWKSLNTYVKEKIKSILDLEYSLKESVLLTACLVDTKRDALRYLLKTCIDKGYSIDEKYLSFINSKEFRMVVYAIENCLIQLDKEINLVNKSNVKGVTSLSLSVLFQYLFGEDVNHFSIFTETLNFYYPQQPLIDIAVENIVEYLKLKKGEKK